MFSRDAHAHSILPPGARTDNNQTVQHFPQSRSCRHAFGNSSRVSTSTASISAVFTVYCKSFLDCSSRQHFQSCSFVGARFAASSSSSVQEFIAREYGAEHPVSPAVYCKSFLDCFITAHSFQQAEQCRCDDGIQQLGKSAATEQQQLLQFELALRGRCGTVVFLQRW